MSEKPVLSLPIYAPFEVIIHNTPNDCWLSFLGKVYNLTPLLKLYKDESCIKPILAFAGKDVSHWFDEKTGDIRHYIHPVTGVNVPYCPHGLLPDISCEVPSTEWKRIEHPWWKSNRYLIGLLTKGVRPLKIINMFIGKEIILKVCCEDTFNRIKERYALFNSEAESYTWLYQNQVLHMDQTMEENGIPDDRENMAELGIPKSYYIPSVQIYYNDDLKHVEELTDDDDELDNEICCTCQKKKEKNT